MELLPEIWDYIDTIIHQLRIKDWADRYVKPPGDYFISVGNHCRFCYKNPNLDTFQRYLGDGKWKSELNNGI